MRVRISYGTDVEEVPEEIGQLFTYVSEKARSAMRSVNDIEGLIDEEEVEPAMILIENLRQKLSLIDQRLADIHSIGNGYLQYKENEGAEDATEGRPSVDTTEERTVSEHAQQPRGNPHNPGT